MGLTDLLRAGGTLERSVELFTTEVVGSGSFDIGSANILFSIDASQPCRLRLYDNQASMENENEKNRPFTNKSVSSSVALIGDFSMSAAGLYRIDPALISFSSTKPGLTYYNIEPASSVNIILGLYNIDDNSVSSVENRKTIEGMTGSLGVSEIHSGSLVAATIPTTYFLISASLDTGVHEARVRLYNSSSILEETTESSNEKARPFTTEISGSFSKNLIVDMVLTGSNHTYFTPKILGVNLQNIDDLSIIKGVQSSILGENEIYYLIENEGAATANISASVHLYSLED